MSNETISSGDCSSLTQQLIKRENSECNALFVRQSLANNELIIDNIFKWLKPSELVKCGEVCEKWAFCARMLRTKRIYFSHHFLYYPLSPNAHLQHIEPYTGFMQKSFEELIKSLDTFIARNKLNEFKVIIIFSRLEYSIWMTLIQQNCLLLKNCKIIHINSEKEIIGTRLGHDTPYEQISAFDTNLFAGISGVFISRDMPGVEINVYKDCQIFNMRANNKLKCVLVFHIWRSFYGHFSRLKTDNEYFECLEQFVISDRLAFGGVTINKLTFTAEMGCDNDSNDSCYRKPYEFCDNVCCVTFSGDNVFAKSFVIDFGDSNVEQVLVSVNHAINETKIIGKTETIAFIFSESLSECATKLNDLFTDTNTTVIGCSGIVHGYDYASAIRSVSDRQSLFYKNNKCVLVWITIKKT